MRIFCLFVWVLGFRPESNQRPADNCFPLKCHALTNWVKYDGSVTEDFLKTLLGLFVAVVLSAQNLCHGFTGWFVQCVNNCCGHSTKCGCRRELTFAFHPAWFRICSGRQVSGTRKCWDAPGSLCWCIPPAWLKRRMQVRTVCMFEFTVWQVWDCPDCWK